LDRGAARKKLNLIKLAAFWFSGFLNAGTLERSKSAVKVREISVPSDQAA
jgi:hypothetical protein